MAHELTHDEASGLLGVYALDALDAGERAAVDRHLAGCAPCRAEVTGHLEVAGLLSSGITRPPAAVWDRIAAELAGTPPPLDLAAVRRQRPRAAPPAPPAPPALRRPGPGRRGRVAVLVAAATIAVAAIGGLGLKVIDDGRRIDRITAGGHADALERTIDAAVSDPAAVRVDLRSPDGSLFAEAWVLPDGRGYLARNNLPTLGPDRNYQLWAVVGGDKISVGVLGRAPEAAAFAASGPVQALAITDEVVGGVVASLQQPVVVGPVGAR